MASLFSSGKGNSVEAFIAGRLLDLKLTLATAESCTGGLIAHRITEVSGASGFFRGGVVAYSNALKESLLEVSHATLAEFGAVSEAVAREMAEGARRLLEADLAVAVTGIAGPTGGTPEKPVGLVYIAVARWDTCRVTQNRFSGDRGEVKMQTADRALAMLKEWLE